MLNPSQTSNLNFKLLNQNVVSITTRFTRLSSTRYKRWITIRKIERLLKWRELQKMINDSARAAEAELVDLVASGASREAGVPPLSVRDGRVVIGDHAYSRK